MEHAETDSMHELAHAAGQALAGERIGILLRDHGEIVEYNITTYTSLRQFFLDLWPYMGLPDGLLEVNEGSYMIDVAHPFEPTPNPRPGLQDAWAQPFEGAAVPVPDPMAALLATAGANGIRPGAFTYLPDGQAVRLPDLTGQRAPTGGVLYLANEEDLQGFHEADILEILALTTYRDWLAMANHSPRYGQGELLRPYLETRLRDLLGDDVRIATAHGIDPKVDPGQTLQAAAQSLVDGGATVIIDAYMSSIHSDIMDTCMMRPHVEHALHDAGFHGRLLHGGQAGLQQAWADGVADWVEYRAGALPTYGRLVVYLVQHGGDPASVNPCGSGPDQYHANAAAQYELASAAVLGRMDRPGLLVRHVYGQDANTTEDGVLSPWEALEIDRRYGTSQVLVVPYEVWGDGVDTLVRLREGLGIWSPTPLYGPDHELSFQLERMQVTVTSGYFAPGARSDAYLEAILEAAAGGSPG